MKIWQFNSNHIISKKSQLEMKYPVYETSLLGGCIMTQLKDIDPQVYKWYANGIFVKNI